MKYTAKFPFLLGHAMRGLLTLVMACSFAAPSVRADLIATDSFEDYTVGSIPTQGAEGDGWGGSWSGIATAQVAAVEEAIAYSQNGITRGGGKSLKFAKAGNSNTALGRLTKDTYKQDIFMSFIFKVNQTNGNLATSSAQYHWFARDAAQGLNVDTIAMVNNTAKISVRVNNSTINMAADTLVNNTVYFCVIKYIWDETAQSYRSCQVWLNPTANDELITGNNSVSIKHTATGGGSSDYRGIYVRTYNGTNADAYYDDIRIGTTWADVVAAATLPVPVITSITPPDGKSLTDGSLHPGDTIKLVGENFQSASTVTINGIPVTSKTVGGTETAFDARNKCYTEMEVTIPVVVGNDLEIVVSNAGGSTAAAQTIRVTAPPAISSVTPVTIAPGGIITLTGEFFIDIVSVMAGAYELEVDSETSDINTLVAILPDDIPLGDYTVTVTTGGGTASTPLTVAPILTVNRLGLDGAAPGEILKISGRFLYPMSPGDTPTTVTIGGVEALIIPSLSDEKSISIAIPDGTADGIIQITGQYGSYTTVPGQFTVRAPATLIAQDDFDDRVYAAGPLVLQNGGEGWADAWEAVNNSFSIVEDEPLTYTLDNGAVIGGGKSLKVAGVANNAIARAVANPVTDGKDVFMSFLFKIKYGGEANDGKDVPAQTFASWAAIPESRVKDATFDTTTSILVGGGGPARLGARIGTSSGANAYVSRPTEGGNDSNNIKSNQVYFAVVRYTGWNGTAYRRSQVWLNPGTEDEGTTDPNVTAIAESSSIATNSTGFGGIGVRTATLSSTNYHVYDNIRIGTSWSMVVSTPKSMVLDVAASADPHPGDIIIIRGIYLTGLQSVKIGGIEAEIINTDTIKPTNATVHARIPAGSQGAGRQIELVTGSGTLVADETLDITLTTPVVTGIEQEGQNVRRNQTITINGQYFTGLVDVKINGVKAEIATGTKAGDGQLKVKVPASVSNGTASVVVTTAGGSVTRTDVFTIEDGQPIPLLSGIATHPELTYIPGDLITIYGENFDTPPVSVKINGLNAEIVSCTDIEIIVKVPQGAAAAATPATSIEVTTAGGVRSYTGLDWTYATAPVIIDQPPEIQPAVAGSSYRAHLVTSATGTDDLTYQWWYRHSLTGIWLPATGSSDGASYGNVTTPVIAAYASGTGEHLMRCSVSTRLATVYTGTITLKFMENLLPSPRALVIDGDDIHVATNHAVRTIAISGSVTTLAGNLSASGTLDGTGTDARFTTTAGLAIDSNGTLLVSATGNNRLRAVTADGEVITIGTGDAAILKSPGGIASLDIGGDTFIADTGNNQIKKITASGEVTVVAGGTAAGWANGPLLDARFKAPASVAVDVSGSYVYVADTGNNQIRLIDLSAGEVSTLAGTGTTAGYYDGDALTEAVFNAPAGLVVDNDGDVYVADTGNHLIRVITNDTVVTLAGGCWSFSGSIPELVSGFRDGPGEDAWFNAPRALALKDGTLYVADTGNAVIRCIAADLSATVTTLEMIGSPSVSTGTTPEQPPTGFGDNEPGGGGATSIWFFAALAALAVLGLRRRR